jgi:hypothetical protein
MKKLLILIVLLAPFLFAYYHKPPFSKHQEKIYLDAMQKETSDDEAVYAMAQWDDLEFVDWLFFTATRDKKFYSLVSFGLVDHVIVIDSDWAAKAFDLKQKAAM